VYIIDEYTYVTYNNGLVCEFLKYKFVYRNISFKSVLSWYSLCSVQPSASDRQLTIWIIATHVWFVILRLLEQQHVDPLVCVAWSWTCMHGLEGHSVYVGSDVLYYSDCV
jgi:hypothetical protein